MGFDLWWHVTDFFGSVNKSIQISNSGLITGISSNCSGGGDQFFEP